MLNNGNLSLINLTSNLDKILTTYKLKAELISNIYIYIYRYLHILHYSHIPVYLELYYRFVFDCTLPQQEPPPEDREHIYIHYMM